VIPVSLAKTRLRRKSRDKIGAFAGVSGPTVGEDREGGALVFMPTRAPRAATARTEAGSGGAAKKIGLVSMRDPRLSALLPDPI